MATRYGIEILDAQGRSFGVNEIERANYKRTDKATRKAAAAQMTADLADQPEGVEGYVWELRGDTMQARFDLDPIAFITPDVA